MSAMRQAPARTRGLPVPIRNCNSALCVSLYVTLRPSHTHDECVGRRTPARSQPPNSTGRALVIEAGLRAPEENRCYSSSGATIGAPPSLASISRKIRLYRAASRNNRILIDGILDNWASCSHLSRNSRVTCGVCMQSRSMADAQANKNPGATGAGVWMINR
jgi:hypothetical protein